VDKNIFGKSDRDHKIGLYERNVQLIDYTKGRASINKRAERIIETVNQFLATQNAD